ncbi:MAG: hypothetical protein GC161_19515 [Planctomycetaceae bacterium]|nr:hypothetical protein [Planctomycetaceae bacterium]
MRAFAASLLLGPALLAGVATAQDINTSALSQNGWYSDDTRADGSGAFPSNTNLVSPTLTDAPEAADPLKFNALHDADIAGQISFQPAPGTVPPGTWLGSVRLFIDPVGGTGGKSQISHRKDDLTGHNPGSVFGPGFTAQYSWMANGPSTITPSLKFGIKTADFPFVGVSSRTGENVWDKVLIYEPGQGNGKVANGLWQTETITHTSGKWWFFDRRAGASSQGTPVELSTMAVSPIAFSGPKTLADVYALITAPGAIITSVQFGIGSNNPAGNVYVNELTTNAYRAGQRTTFGPPPPFVATNVAVGTTPSGVILATLDGNNSRDIATADAGSDSVTVRFNDGAGAFPTSATVNLGVGDAPVALASGDLVSGGGTDLAVAAEGSNRVVILDNDPVGTLAEAASLSTLPATKPVSVAVGDLDGSGTADLVVAMQGDLLFAGSGSVAVSLNGGALAPLTAPVGGFLRPQRVAIGDLDGDGDNDVVATMAGTGFTPTTSNNVLLYENLGGGSFGAPISLGVAQNPKAVAVGDLDGDLDLDLAVTAESFPILFPGDVRVFTNDGLTAGSWTAGDFLAGGTFAGGSFPTDLAIGDLDDDSLPGFISRQDIVAADFGSTSATRYDAYDGVLNTFGGTDSFTVGNAPSSVAIGGLDGDRTADFVVANAGDGTVTVFLSYTPTLAQNFGAGCPGTGALVPVISAVGAPTLGNAGFGVAVSQARAFAPAFLALSLGQVTLPVGGSCNLYLETPLVLVASVTNAFGTTSVSVPVPAAAPNVLGVSAYFQYVIFDPAGAGVLGTAFSNALRVKLGL